MKRTITGLIVLVLFASVPVLAGTDSGEAATMTAPGIKAGNIGIKMNMQSIASMPIGDEGTEQNLDFYLKRLRVIFSGDVVPVHIREQGRP